ncbi:MAG: hypothetical protein HLUCCO07_03555 [Rhodobacteraceae bacterium HLUCCO07]|nr:MAG: hypothetical protein HLUCCO07_03555 [Rhodobacteraceae bacterium HLUCCO07]
MTDPIFKTTVSFAKPFRISGLDGLLPAGDYDLETEIQAPPDHLNPERWKASVMVQLHARRSHPGLSRNLTVPLSALDHALTRDGQPANALVDFLVEEMLADPMIRLVMMADRVSEAEIRQIYAQGNLAGCPDTGGDHGGSRNQPKTGSAGRRCRPGRRE